MRTCQFCGKVENPPYDKHAFITCDVCGKTFCKEHIYTGNSSYKNACEACLKVIAAEQRESASSKDSGSLYKEMETKFQTDSEVPDAPTATNRTHASMTADELRTKFPNAFPNRRNWEYKMEYQAIPSEMDYDYALFEKKSNVPLEPYQFDPADSPVPNIEWMNKLGAEGWELISVIPKTKGLIMRGADYRDFSLAGGNVVGVYMLFKREKSIMHA